MHPVGREGDGREELEIIRDGVVGPRITDKAEGGGPLRLEYPAPIKVTRCTSGALRADL